MVESSITRMVLVAVSQLSSLRENQSEIVVREPLGNLGRKFWMLTTNVATLREQERLEGMVMQGNPSRPMPTRTVVIYAILCVGFVAVVVLIFIGLLNYVAKLESGPSRNSLTEQLMNRKSVALQEIMDSLVRSDFGGVSKAADKMKRLGDTADWFLRDEDYNDDGVHFRDSTMSLIDSANKKDYEAAALAYDELATSCIDCHRRILKQPTRSP